MSYGVTSKVLTDRQTDKQTDKKCDYYRAAEFSMQGPNKYLYKFEKISPSKWPVYNFVERGIKCTTELWPFVSM